MDKTFATRYPARDMSHPQISPPDSAGSVLLRDEASGQWLLFEQPVEILRAGSLSDVLPTLRALEDGVERGLYAAGFITYEAAPAFDRAFRTRNQGPIPLAWFGLYAPPRIVSLPPSDDAIVPRETMWEANVPERDYLAAVARIRSLIAAGDTYQVNYTFRLRARVPEDPWTLFLRLQRAQRAPYGAFLQLGDDTICSASPELFFTLNENRIECRPMKGTRPRGLTEASDRELGATLATSRKDRAENVMIVDMVRNDLGRVCAPGSVETLSLFDVARFPTLWQMTSTVRGTSSAPISEIFGALFPCASITGAPKVRTMEIIAGLETAPRGIYTGCIGFVAPGLRAQFNVAIRTAHVRRGGDAEYGTGGGVVWDSSPDGEYAECLTKAAILRESAQPFQLLETLLWEPDGDFLFLDGHLSRIAASAEYFGFPFDADHAMRALAGASASFGAERRRVRLLLDESGAWHVESAPVSHVFQAEPDSRATPWRVALAAKPVSSDNRFLYHKTTRREVYDDARHSAAGAEDVILFNERGEVTESTIANVVAVLDGEWITPPVECGLLAGVFREHLLHSGRIREGALRAEDLPRTSALYLVNSVRGWIPCRMR